LSSTFPIEVTIGGFSIPLHAVLETLGIFVGFRLFLCLRKKRGDVLENSQRIWIIAAATIGALIGSRLIGALENPIAWYESDNPLMHFVQNKTVVGGFLGGLLFVECTKMWLGEKRSSGDLFVYPLIAALIIGRMGCFTMGVYEETYGTQTNLPFGMNLGDGMMRHPVTLYEIVFLGGLGFALESLRRTQPLESGALFKLFMIAYLVFRFFLDFIKPHYTLPIGLSTIQLTCLFGILYYSPFIFSPKKLLAKSYA
jgi:phosphatidylglycerol:prolipoprotein diacylglycerol transferase